MENKFILGIVVLLLVGAGAFYLLQSSAPEVAPLAPEVKVTVYYSSVCKAFCSTSLIESVLAARLVNVSFERVDVSTPSGRAKADELRLMLVPAFIINGSSLDNSPRKVFVQSFLTPLGSGDYVVTTRESYSGFMFRNVPSENRTIELFVSSYDKDSLAIENYTFGAFPSNGSIKIQVWYFPKENIGEIEAAENFRQACIRANYSDAFSQYVLCRGRYLSGCNFETSFLFCGFAWEECSAPLGIPAKVVEACTNSSASSIFAEDVRRKTSLNIFYYPSYVIGNQYIRVGLPKKEDLAKNVCQVYPDIPECQ